MALPQFGSPDPKGHAPSVDPVAKDYNDRYEVDRVSLFCGNLPVGTTKDHVAELFQAFGAIINVLVRESQSKFDRKYLSDSSASLLTRFSYGQSLLCLRSIR